MTRLLDMPLWQLQERLRSRGVRLWAEAGALRFEAPAGAMDPELRAALADHKAALLADLGEAEGRDSGLVPIRPAPEDRHRPFPLTDLQQAYWVGEKGGAPQSAVPCYIHDVEVDPVLPDQVQAALDLLLDRHEVLRSRFLPDGRQRIAPPGELRCLLDSRDFSALAPGEAEARTRALAADYADTHLPDLETGPPLAATLVQMPGGCRLILGLRLIVLDGPSLARLFHELLAALYGADLPAPARTLSYRDYVLALADLARDRAEAYWREELPKLPPPPELPRSGRAPRRSRFVRLAGRVPPEAWARLRSGARARGLTPNAVLLALYAAVLRPWAAAPDFTLNVLGNFRPFDHPEMVAVVGNHTNTLLTPCAPADRFSDQARQLQQALAERLTHGAVSGVSLCRELHRQGDSDTPPAPFVFTSGIGPGTAALPPALQGRFRTINSALRTPQVWLDHQVIETHDGLLFYWDYVEEIFEPGLPEAMFARYEAALDALLSEEAAWDRPDPARPAQPVLRPLAAGQTPDPAATLGREFLAVARQQPGAVALIAADGTRMDYAALAEAALRVAGGLAAAGYGTGDLIAVLLPRGVEQIVAVLGVSLAGMAWLPLDPQLPAARKRAILAQSRAAAAISHDDLDIETLRPAELRAAPPVGTAAEVDGTALAYVIYTSGSTGQPKGVAIRHRAVLNTLDDINLRFGIGCRDRVLALSALSFDLSVYDIWGSLLAGAALVLPEDRPIPDPAKLLAQCRRDEVTVWNSVPAFLEMAFLEGAEAVRRALVALRVVMLSGDWIPLPLARAVLDDLPGAELHALGGATEASIWSNSYAVTQIGADWCSVPYGFALSGQQLHVLDPAGHACPPLATGEIHIEGLGLAEGYLHDPDRTAASFVTHASGRRLYATGDLGRLRPDGAIEFLGRKDFQLKLRGFRIEAGEVESHLLDGTGLTAAAVLVAREPGGQPCLVAACTGGLPDPEGVQARLRRHLPDYMVPRHLIMVDAIPLSRNGKRDRAALLALVEERLAARAPDSPPDVTASDGSDALAQLWATHVGAAPGSAAAHFFRDGGTSVQAVRFVQAVRQQMSADLDLASLFENPTFGAFSALLRPPEEETAP